MTRYTDREMVRRLLTWLLTMVVTAAPAAAQICETTCAGRASSVDRTSPQQGSSHHQQPSGIAAPAHHHGAPAIAVESTVNVQGVNAQPRACAHPAVLAGESRENSPGSCAPPAIVSATAAAPLIHAIDVRHVDRRHSPPAAIRSAAPLRI